MPKSCRAPHCSNAAGQPRPPSRRLSFYKFPLRDSARLRLWLAQMRQEGDWVPTRHQHLCSDHFEPSCFQYRWGVRYLRHDAVPTIFTHGPTKQKAPRAPPGTAQPQQPLPASTTQQLAPERAPPTPDPSSTTPGHTSEGMPTCPAPEAWAQQTEDGGTKPSRPHLEPLPVPSECPMPTPPKVCGPASASKGAQVARAGQVAPGEPSTEELVRLVLGLQRKVKVLQQRHRRHRARLQAMEGLVEQLRRHSIVSEERLQLACLQPGQVGTDAAVTIICQEEEEQEEEEEEVAAATLVYAVPPVPPPEGTAGGALGP